MLRTCRAICIANETVYKYLGIICAKDGHQIRHSYLVILIDSSVVLA